jgi:fermentation-respiration switch protein FrsA (DUF1100 family)
VARVVLVMLGCAIVWIALGWVAQRAVLFPAPAAPPEPPDARRQGFELWRVGPRNDVEAFALLPRAGGGPTPVLVATHGNGELIDWWIEPYESVRRWGIAVVLVEYPGYGRSGGSPGERAITEVMLSVFDRIAEHPDLDDTAVVLHGRSLGGGAACALAARRPVRAMVLESTFTSVRSFAVRYGLIGPLVRDPFDNLAVVSQFDGPILILHGRRDPIIPVEHAYRLHEAAPHSELELLDCGHNDCPPSWDRIRRFLTEVGVIEG